MSLDSGSPFELARGTSVYGTAGAAEISAVVKATPGILFGLRIVLSAAPGALGWVQLFDAAAVPADGTVPYWRIAIPATSVEVFDDFPRPLVFSTGIVIANSTTVATLTNNVLGAGTFYNAQFI